MEIRNPMYKPDDYVVNGQGVKGFVVRVENYNFDDNEYTYIVKTDETFIDEAAFISEDEYNLDPCQEPPKSVWKLKEGDECFFITAIGNVFSRKWDGSYCALRNMEIGNVFLAKEEALVDLERRKVEVEMLCLGGRRKFKYNGPNYCICYNDGLCIESYPCTFNQGGIYFDSVKEAMEVVKTIGDDRIKKYIFGVNE